MSTTSMMTTDPRTLAAGKPGDARLIQENRLLWRVVFVAVGLLAPLFTVGYTAGRLTAPAPQPRVALAVVNPPPQPLVAPPSAPQKAGEAAKAQKAVRRKIRRRRPQPVAASPETTSVSLAGESNPVAASR